MAALDDNVAGAPIGARVDQFYERHPYPPPIEDLKGYARSWDDAQRRATAHLLWPDLPFRANRNILVAGCGTSQAAKIALRWPKAKVVGIDFSEASIAATAALKRKHSIHNLELMQLPIEDAEELGRHFEHIVCTGVLHHLPDPGAGLRTLASLLDSDGAMQLMLYAPYGRAGIYMIQDYCRRLGIGTSTSEIEQLAASLNALPPNHPIVPLLRNAPDFASEAGLADALLHPQDRAFSVPEVMELLCDAGLSFARWERQAPYLPHCGALVQSPHRQRLARLPEPEQYAALELFRGGMVEHSLIVRKGDAQRSHAVDFDGDEWLDYVPIKVSGTIVVRERLPPGAAAVLINPSHTFTDIYLPVTPEQLAMVELIDGLQSIGEIVAEPRHSVGRTLFERLWHYDQVVFARSNQAR